MERIYQFEHQPNREAGGSVTLQTLRQRSGSLSAPIPDRTSDPAFDRGLHPINQVQALQRTIGNRGIQRLVSPEPRQTVPTLPSADFAGTIFQPRCACGDRCPQCSQRKTESDRTLQTVVQRKQNGKPLESNVRSQMESQFGEDFRDVRIHTDSETRHTARQLEAEAYTVRKNIFFDAGKYDPHSYRGRRLLAHELTHVVQQTRGVRPFRSRLVVGQQGDRYEREADRIAERVVRRSAPPVGGHHHRGDQVRVQERWRSSDLLLSRAPATTADKKAAPVQTASLTPPQIACIKRVYEQTMAMPKPDRWQRCYVTAKTATCNLPTLQNMAAAKALLNDAITPADWEQYLADPKGLICRTQGGQAPEICCEDAPPPKEKPKESAPSSTKR